MTQPPSDFNQYGVVDLAALAKQRQAQEQAAATGAEATAPGGVNVIEVSDLTFEQEVVQRSLTVPVVLDFWATWCQPCKQLSPLLERFAEQDAGRWVLGTIDVDANPQLAAAAQVQSIPTVMVVWQGQVIPGFTGALPESAVREFLDQVIGLIGEVTSAEDPEQLLEDPEQALEDPELVAADDALADGDFDAAAAIYQQRLAARPDDVEAQHGLARLDWLRRTETHDRAEVLRTASDKPDDIPSQLLAADMELLNGDAEQAFDRLVALVQRLDAADRQQVTDHLLGLLDVVGNDEPLVLDARRRLASVLF